MKFSSIIKDYEELIAKPHMAKMPLIFNGVKKNIGILEPIKDKEITEAAVEKLDLSASAKKTILIKAGLLKVEPKVTRSKLNAEIRSKEKEIAKLHKELEKKDKEIDKLAAKSKK